MTFSDRGVSSGRTRILGLPKVAGRRVYFAALGPMVFISCIFVAANLAIFSFPEAVFWDDWTLYGTQRAYVIGSFTESGFPHVGYLTWTLTFLGPGGVRVLVFFVGLSNALLWFQILRVTPNIGLDSLVLSVALATSFPFFLARVATINTLSVIALFVFLFGWLAFLRGTINRNRKGAILGLWFVFFSGILYSAFVPMVLLVFLHVALVLYRSEREVPWKKIVTGMAVLLFMHGLVLSLQRIVFRPYGMYEGYRTILFGGGQIALFLIGVAALLFFITLLTRREATSVRHYRYARAELAVFAIISFLLAVASYTLMGSLPPYSEWQTRYELNYFIPTTLLLIVIFESFDLKTSKKVFHSIAAILLVVTILHSNYLLSRFYVDWEKHSHVTEVLSSHSEQLVGTFVVVVDETAHLNAMGRQLRPYEWSGVLSDAIGTRNTFAVGASDFDGAVSSYLNGDFDRNLKAVYNYRWEDHAFPSDSVLVTISAQRGASCGTLGFSIRNCIAVDINAGHLSG